MGVSKRVTIWCDGCSIWEQASATAAQFRRELRARGWLVGLPGGVDYCPKCAEVQRGSTSTGVS